MKLMPILEILKKQDEVFASVEIIRHSETFNTYNFLLMKRDNSKVVIIDKMIGVENPEIFSDIIHKKTPLVLSFSGTGVLYKKARFEENNTFSDEEILRRILPNANPQDFLFEIHKVKTGTIFCALMRRNIVKETINQWITRGAFIMDVGIGMFVVAEILTLIENRHLSRINIQNYKLIIQDGVLYDYIRLKNKSSNAYLIGGENLSGDLLPAFANTFRYFILKSKISSLKTIEEQRNEFYHYKTSSKLFKVIIAIVIFILSGSFSMRYFLSGRLAQTEARLETSRQVLSEYRMLNENYQRKKDILKARGIDNENYISVLIDKIVRDVPGSVYLTSIQYNPRLKRPKDNQLFSENEMIISGNASDVKELYRWINNMDKLDSVVNVKLSSYNYVKDKGWANFDIVITLES